MKPRLPDWLMHPLGRPVAIFGGGVSGRAAAGLVRACGAEAVIYDREAEDLVRRQFGAAEAARHRLAVTSPGFEPGHDWVRAARSGGCEVLNEIDLGALAWPGRIIAVTGTNGKTTLTEFLVHALRQEGRSARAVGNIGDALSDAWREPSDGGAIAVCEVSSFQAEMLRFFEAEVSIWTNFAEDHLDRHGSLEAYFRAKLRLVKRTRGQRVFFGPSVLEHARGYGIDLPAGRCIAVTEAPGDPLLSGTPFERMPQRENFLLARAVWAHLGFAAERLLEAARTFTTGPHRLARAGEVRGVSFWNDSKATNFHAAEAALASFELPVLWIGGGRAKGGDLRAFASRIASRIRRAYLIGETGPEMAEHLRAQAVPVTMCPSLREAVTRAHAAASAGDAVVLSPGFASFDLFRSYDDRGRQFEALVAALQPVSPQRFSPHKPKSSNRPVAPGLCLP